MSLLIINQQKIVPYLFVFFWNVLFETNNIYKSTWWTPLWWDERNYKIEGSISERVVGRLHKVEAVMSELKSYNGSKIDIVAMHNVMSCHVMTKIVQKVLLITEFEMTWKASKCRKNTHIHAEKAIWLGDTFYLSNRGTLCKTEDIFKFWWLLTW